MKIVIFGASGDLAKRKLFPAFSCVNIPGIKTELIGYSRKDMKNNFIKKISEFKNYSFDFLKTVKYIQGDYKNLDILKEELKNEVTPIYYFSVPSEVYPLLLTELHRLPIGKIAIEKPFGSDLTSFNVIKAHIESHHQSQFYFIDHYLLKRMAIAIPEILSKNQEIFNLLNNKNILNIEILFKEQLGGEGRAYFDKYGITKDVMQNHLCEIYALIASNVTDYKNENLISEERLKVLKDTLPIDKFMFGQYNEYPKELGRESDSETFSIVALNNKNEKWKGVPFIISAGKGLDKKECRIILEFNKNVYNVVSNIILKNNSLNETKKINVLELNEFLIVFEFSPIPSCYFQVNFKDGKINKYMLYDENMINEMTYKKFGNFSDHEIIFNSLVDNKPFPVSNVKEAEETWYIFNKVLNTKKKSLFNYCKGVKFPKEGIEFIKNIKFGNI